MPVVAVARAANPRKRDHVWLIVALALPLVLLASLAVAPFFGPVDMQVGSHVVRLIYYRLPAPGKSGMHVGQSVVWMAKKPWHFTARRAVYRGQGSIQARELRIGSGVYWLEWFRGRRVR
jgi:hypothetical protein